MTGAITRASRLFRRGGRRRAADVGCFIFIIRKLLALQREGGLVYREQRGRGVRWGHWTTTAREGGSGPVTATTTTITVTVIVVGCPSRGAMTARGCRDRRSPAIAGGGGGGCTSASVAG